MTGTTPNVAPMGVTSPPIYWWVVDSDRGGGEMSDIITNFVEQSHNEQGPRTELRMRKETDGAGFCIRAKGGKEAIKHLAEALNAIDLEEAGL
jgi:hypothetical protein